MRISIRWIRLLALTAVCLLTTTAFGPVASAQTPAASPGTDLFSSMSFEPGVVPTIFGDVALPDRRERVITLTDGSLDAMLTLDVAPVGATASSNATSAAAYLMDVVPADMAYVGGWSELDIEMIVGLKPDLILADRYLPEDQYQTLSAIAPVVAPQEIDVDSAAALQQWEYEQLVWGHAIDRDDDSQAGILALRGRAAQFQQQAGDHLGESVVVFRPQPDFPVVMSHAWMTGTILTWAGFTGNAYTASLEPPHSAKNVSLEQLQLLDADWLFAAARDQEQRDSLTVYEQNPLVQSLTASQKGQIAMVPGDLWSGATGVLAGHAMLDDIERIIIDGER